MLIIIFLCIKGIKEKKRLKRNGKVEKKRVSGVKSLRSRYPEIKLKEEEVTDPKSIILMLCRVRLKIRS